MLREIFFRDFGWKLFSLLLAAFIWVTVHKIIEEPQALGVPAITATYGQLPVLIVATAADMHLYRVKPDHASVTVSGPADIMSTLQENEIRVTVDLSRYDPASGMTQPVDVSVPGGVTLVRVNPMKVDVIAPARMGK